MRIFLALILAAGIVAVSGCGGSDCGTGYCEYTEYAPPPEPTPVYSPAIATPPPAPSCNPCAGI